MRFLANLFLVALFSLFTPLASAESALEVHSFTLNNRVHVKIIEAPFEQWRHEITLCNVTAEGRVKFVETYICKIDGMNLYGAGEYPEPITELKAIIINIKGKSYKLDISQMYNAWGYSHDKPDLYWSVYCNNKSCFVKGKFSSNTGSFIAKWKIFNDKSKRILIREDVP